VQFVCGPPSANNDGLGRDAPVPTWFSAYYGIVGQEWALDTSAAPAVTLMGLCTSIEGVHFPFAAVGQSGHASMVFCGDPQMKCRLAPPPQNPPFALYDGANAILGNDLSTWSIDTQNIAVTTHARLRTRNFAGGVTPFTFGYAAGAGQSHKFVDEYGLFVSDDLYLIAGDMTYHSIVNGTGQDVVSLGFSVTVPVSYDAFLLIQGGQASYVGPYAGSGGTGTRARYTISRNGQLNDQMTPAGVPAEVEGTVAGGWYNGNFTPPRQVQIYDYDLATASGTVTFGTGFAPSRVTIRGGIDTVCSSDGAVYGSAAVCTGTNSAGRVCVQGHAVFLAPTNSDHATGDVTLTATGFELAWTKTGSPTGTATLLVVYE
jgi:hypothetical protein